MDNKYFRAVARICYSLTHIFAKTFAKVNIFAKFSHYIIWGNKFFAKMGQNFMSSNYLLQKMVLFQGGGRM